MTPVLRHASALTAAVLLSCSGAAFAAHACQPQNPVEVAQATLKTLRNELQTRDAELKQNPEALYELIERLLVPHFDIDYMARLILGRHARRATPEQIRRFAVALKETTKREHGDALFDLHKIKIEFLPLRVPEGADDVTLKAVVTTERGEEHPVRANVHLVDCKWQVYNASVGNLSLVINLRDDFDDRISFGGLEGVIEKMEEQYGGGK